MNPGVTGYFGTGAADRDVTDHMGHLKIKYLGNFTDPG